MTYYEKNHLIACVSIAVGVTLMGVGGILAILDGQAWEIALCGVGLLCLGFSAIADN